MNTADAVDRGLVPPTRPEGFGPPDMLRTIFTHPRATMRWVLDHGDRGLWVLLLIPWLLAQGLSVASGAVRYFASPPSPLVSPAVAITGAVALCAAGALGFTASLMIATRLMGGVARPAETLRAVAWGGIPVIAALPYLLASRWLDPALLPEAVAVLRGFQFVMGMLSAVLTVLTIAEANRLPWQKGLAALALAVVFPIASGIIFWMVLSPLGPILQNLLLSRPG